MDWPLEKDLAFRAHRLLEQHAGRSLPIDLRLRKVIPPGAGLGGGSSNAAATLVGIDRLFNLRTDPAKLLELAQTLGSDVGFLSGNTSSAIVTGLGETVEPSPLPQPIDLVLIFPSFGCPTGDVYRAFDQLHGPFQNGHPQADERRVRAIAKQSPLPPDAPFNDLAEPACIVRPELRRIITQLRDALHLPAHVTGSGSTLFVIAPDATTAQALARTAADTTGLPAVATDKTWLFGILVGWAFETHLYLKDGGRCPPYFEGRSGGRGALLDHRPVPLRQLPQRVEVTVRIEVHHPAVLCLRLVKPAHPPQEVGELEVALQTIRLGGDDPFPQFQRPRRARRGSSRISAARSWAWACVRSRAVSFRTASVTPRGVSTAA